MLESFEGLLRPWRGFRSLRALAAGVLFAGVTLGQCELGVDLPYELPGCDTAVAAMTHWDPDGPGARTPVVVAGGNFRYAGDVASSGVATYDLATNAWSALGTPAQRRVLALAAMPDGRLAVGGRIGTSGSVETWDGTTWTSLVSTVNGDITCLAAMPNGDLVAGGQFTSIDGISCNRIARWNGTNWSPLGIGLDANVRALAVAQNGDLFVGGDFVFAGGVFARRLAKWDGSNWSEFGSPDFAVHALAFRPNGDLVIGGQFHFVAGIQIDAFAVWNGTQWSGFLPPMSTLSRVDTLHALPNGDVLVGGNVINLPQAPMTQFAVWRSGTWQVLVDASGGTPPEMPVYCSSVGPDGSFYIGGLFDRCGTLGTANIARWDGSAWRRTGTGFGSTAVAIAADDQNGFVVAVERRGITDFEDCNIARWRNGVWSRLGNGIRGKPLSLAVLPDDGVVAVLEVDFLLKDVYRWDGANWNLLVGGLSVAPVVQRLRDGSLVLGGQFTQIGGVSAANIARWDGTQWQAMGAGTNGQVKAFGLMPDDTLLIGGSFTVAGGIEARAMVSWRGGTWSPFGSGLADVDAISCTLGGRVYVGGSTRQPVSASSSAYAWDGSAWQFLNGIGVVNRIAPLADDRVLVVDGSSALRTWDGSSAAPVFSGLRVNRLYSRFATLSNGDVVVVGQSWSIDRLDYFARITAPCGASANPFGVGCLGASLRAVNHAWSGGECRVRGEGLGSAQFAVVATGFQPVSYGLDLLLPQGVPGCFLLVSPDVGRGQLAVVTGGVAESSLSIPRSATFYGLGFRQQMVPVEFGVTGSIVAVTSTNAIDHVIGHY